MAAEGPGAGRPRLGYLRSRHLAATAIAVLVAIAVMSWLSVGWRDPLRGVGRWAAAIGVALPSLLCLLTAAELLQRLRRQPHPAHGQIATALAALGACGQTLAVWLAVGG